MAYNMKHKIFEVKEIDCGTTTHWFIGPSEDAVKETFKEFCIGEEPETIVEVREIDESEANSIMINCEEDGQGIITLLELSNDYIEGFVQPIAGDEY